VYGAGGTDKDAFGMAAGANGRGVAGPPDVRVLPSVTTLPGTSDGKVKRTK
jgi:hypothetical protein